MRTCSQYKSRKVEYNFMDYYTTHDGPSYKIIFKKQYDYDLYYYKLWLMFLKDL